MLIIVVLLVFAGHIENLLYTQTMILIITESDQEKRCYVDVLQLQRTVTFTLVIIMYAKVESEDTGRIKLRVAPVEFSTLQ